MVADRGNATQPRRNHSPVQRALDRFLAGGGSKAKIVFEIGTVALAPGMGGHLEAEGRREDAQKATVDRFAGLL